MLVLALGLSGCAATVTGLKYKDLDVQTKMSETIFLEPVSPDQRTVWFEVKSTCAAEGLDFSPMAGVLTARGYRLVTDPEAARYQFQITCLSVEKTSTAAIDTPLGQGAVLGIALVGAIAGAALGDVTGFVGGAVGAGLAELAVGALVKRVTYTMVTDVQVSERSASPVVREQTATLPQGTQTQVRKQEAKPLLVQDLLRTLAGIL